MTPLEKFRQQVAIAKASEPGVKRYVVQTADEAQALLDEIQHLFFGIDVRRIEPPTKAVAKGTLGDDVL